MKIAYLSGNQWPGREPGLSFSLHNARGFREIGADLSLLLFDREGAGSERIGREFFGERETLLPRIVPIGAPLLSGSRQVYYWRASRHLASGGYDCLVFRALSFLPWAIRLRRRTGMPVWYEAHDFWLDPALRDEELKRSSRRHIRLEQRWVPEVDGVICVSEPQAELYRRHLPEKPVVAAPTSCQPPRPRERREFSFTLGYVGSLNESKYPLEVVLRALPLLSRADVRLLVVGARDDEQREELEATAARLGVAERVEVHGWRVGAELAELEARMDAGVACLAPTFLNRIASPLKVLEYLATGTPFVATRLDGIERLVTDGVEGRLVDNTPRAWAAAIDGLYSDFEAWRRMSGACLETAERRSWANRARTISAALEEHALAQSS